MLGRGSIRRPATMRPSTWRLSSISRYRRSRSGSSLVSHMNTEIWPVPSASSAPAPRGAVIAMVPCVVVYVALQRFYVRGLVSGALKG